MISENDIRFMVDLHQGQKTGYFLDQRENRKAARALAHGKRVLDLYTYTGGFALNCARGGASEVMAVDSSGDALAIARQNAQLNAIANVAWKQRDVLEFLNESGSERFDLIVVDPPRLSTSHKTKERALRMYHHINVEALKRLDAKGILVTCSCSGGISPSDFLGAVASAARKARRRLQLMEMRGAASDHPVLLHCPESHYLKCAVIRACD
jgi:23S rRNA (cytosine1962-C5)-methyltransferase